MRKLAISLLGAAALTMGSAANAGPVVFNDIDNLLLFLGHTENFGATLIDEPGEFLHHFDFTLWAPYSANGQVSEIQFDTNDIDFDAIYIDNPLDPLLNFHQTDFDPDTETWQLSPVDLASGYHAIWVHGYVTGASGDGSYVGTLNLGVPQTPEPGTWAMMLLGFGAAGFAMRRRRKPALAQIA